MTTSDINFPVNSVVGTMLKKSSLIVNLNQFSLRQRMHNDICYFPETSANSSEMIVKAIKLLTLSISCFCFKLWQIHVLKF